MKKAASPKVSGHFIEPMLLLRTEALPDDPSLWRYEIKHDGYRAVAIKTGGKLHLRSRNDNDFVSRYPVDRQPLGRSVPRKELRPF
jgi:ATP-dependent DNA ligase